MKREAATVLAEKLHGALASWDVDAIRSMLDEDFVAVAATAGLPLGLGGAYTGRGQMISEFWLKLGKNFAARAHPTETRPAPTCPTIRNSPEPCRSRHNSERRVRGSRCRPPRPMLHPRSPVSLPASARPLQESRR
jgi:hypothetical protein